MKIQSITLAAALAVLQFPAMAMAQQAPAVDHSAHQTGSADAGAECMAAQSKVAVTGETARGRLEEARQTNEPAKLRAAVDEALIAITSLLAATEPCRQAPAMAGMDHSTMAMPQAGGSVSAPPAAAAAGPHAGMKMPAAPAKRPATRGGRSAQKPAPADPHAGMTMPAAPAKTPAKPTAKPAAAKPGSKPEATPADPHAGMNMAPTGAATADDPKKLTCATAVDPDNAPSTTYKGKTYYFCSAADRLRFIMNPVAYLKGAGGK